jgi:hypothetical protein
MSGLLDGAFIELVTAVVALVAVGGLGVLVLPWRNEEVDEVSRALEVVGGVAAAALARGATEVARAALSIAEPAQSGRRARA